MSPDNSWFFKKPPLSFLSGYWKGRVQVTITQIQQKIWSTGSVGLTSPWSSVYQPISSGQNYLRSLIRQPAQQWSRHRGRWAAEQSSPQWTWSWPPPPVGPSGGPSGRSSGPASPPLSPEFRFFPLRITQIHLRHHPDWHHQSIPGKCCHVNVTGTC